MRKLTDTKRANGRFYTRGNPFDLRPFHSWAENANLKNTRLLEPFAGANHIVKSLQSLGLCNDFVAYDVEPNDDQVLSRDTIKKFPTDFGVCVTNPPWLARNSATRRGLPYPTTKYDDMYKHCLELCLGNCDYVAALLPASFLHSGILRARLTTYILLHDALFMDTDNPVCLALFEKQNTSDVEIYYDHKPIGKLNKLEKHVPAHAINKNVRFNDVSGELGFISFDNTRNPSIRFCPRDELTNYKIRESSRFITMISGNFRVDDSLIKRLNERITEFRARTKDVFLTPFKGIRSDGQYRRRMDFHLTRRFINAA